MSSVWSGYGYETSTGKDRRPNGEEMNVLTFNAALLMGVFIGGNNKQVWYLIVAVVCLVLGVGWEIVTREQ